MNFGWCIFIYLLYVFFFKFIYSVISFSECTCLILVGFLLNYEKMDCGEEAVSVYVQLLPQH